MQRNQSNQLTNDKNDNLDNSIGKIIVNTVGKGIANTTMNITGGEPVTTLGVGAILGLGAVITSPIWILGVGPYAIGKKISNSIKKKKIINSKDQDLIDKKPEVDIQNEINNSVPIVKKNLSEPKLYFSIQVRNKNNIVLSTLEKLPKGIKNLIGKFLKQEDMNNLMSTSKSMHSFFKSSWKATALLNFVNLANYAKASKLVAQDPFLIFKPSTIIYSNGMSEIISPLRLAVKLCDTYMWRMFKDHIILNKHPQLKQLFEMQVCEQAAQLIHLDEYINAYQYFHKLYLRQLEVGDVAIEDLSQALINVANAIRGLPAHVWYPYQLSRWTDQSDFSLDMNVLAYANNVDIVPSFKSNTGLGYDNICFRGKNKSLSYYGVSVSALKLHDGKTMPGMNMEKINIIAEGLQQDIQIFKSLLEYRMQDIKNELSNFNSKCNYKINL